MRLERRLDLGSTVAEEQRNVTMLLSDGISKDSREVENEYSAVVSLQYQNHACRVCALLSLSYTST
jgi:hypothetical protein